MRITSFQIIQRPLRILLCFFCIGLYLNSLKNVSEYFLKYWNAFKRIDYNEGPDHRDLEVIIYNQAVSGYFVKRKRVKFEG